MLQEGEIVKVPLDKLYRFGNRFGMTGTEIIINNRCITRFDEIINDMGTDVTGPARNKNVHTAASLCFLALDKVQKFTGLLFEKFPISSCFNIETHHRFRIGFTKVEAHSS